jgi:hypothetical protein
VRLYYDKNATFVWDDPVNKNFAWKFHYNPNNKDKDYDLLIEETSYFNNNKVILDIDFSIRFINNISLNKSVSVKGKIFQLTNI